MTLKDLFKTGTKENQMLAAQLILGMNKKQFMAHIHEWLFGLAYLVNRNQPRIYSFVQEYDHYYEYEEYFMLEIESVYSNRGGFGWQVKFEYKAMLQNLQYGTFSIRLSKQKAKFKTALFFEKGKKSIWSYGTMKSVKEYFAALIKYHEQNP